MRRVFFMSAPFFIVGPTAVGKSSLAVKVAARCGAEIIGADAFQIYDGFDLLTAKPSQEDRRCVPHHLLGTVSPGTTYNVARYLEDAQRCLASVFGRGKPAMVVGGTGLYVKALTHGLSPLPEANAGVRAELELLGTPTLLARLRGLDPSAAGRIDVHNRRRLIRAIEVCLLTGQPFSSHQTLWDQKSSHSSTNGVFLVREKTHLQARIEQRVAGMFAHGVVDEVRIARTLSLSPTASRMIGWQDIEDYLSGRQSLTRCREKIMLSTRRYAKRQVTWFRREKSFAEVDLSTLPDEQAQISLLTERFLNFQRETRMGSGVNGERT